MKRIFDVVTSSIGLIFSLPILLPMIFLVWIQDGHSPFYIASRVGKDGILFRMIKLRSMVINADKNGVDSTSSSDTRITFIGHLVRKYKLDELTQLWNVLKGDMSLVGPRPNVKRETDLYTLEERRLLIVRPGITDFSSIVFYDEGEVLQDQIDPDIAYNQLIRPGKSKLGLFYIERRSLFLDIKLCLITILAIFSRRSALQQTKNIIQKLKGNKELVKLAGRRNPLVPMPPPGSTKIVTVRDGHPLT